MSAATCGKRPNPIRVRNLARFTLCHDQILARHRSPRQMRRTGASPAVDAMTIDQRNRSAFQHVSCPATNASTSDFHMICLVQFNHELTRMNTNSCSRGRRTRAWIIGHSVLDVERFPLVNFLFLPSQLLRGVAAECTQRQGFNGAEGISDIEGKVARVSDEELGQRPTFKRRN